MAMSASSSSPVKLAEVEPRCAHFGDCGGCRLQNLAYEAQVEKKKAYLLELLERIEWRGEITMHPSPEPWYYRNKMEFSFQDVFPAPEEGEDHLLLGLKRRNRWDKVMNLSECHLLSPEAPKLLDSVHAWARKENLEPYNLHKHVGFLRHLAVREGKNTGESMVNLLTGPGEFPRESFVKSVLDVYPATTILRGVHSEKSDVAVSKDVEVLHGPGVIYDELLGKRFRISPYSFFQTNTKGAEFLYTLIRDWVSQLKPKNVIDLYCGGGGISLTVADLCERVMGVELVESAIEDARHNSQENSVTNCEFMTAKVEDVLPGLASQKIDVDVALLDPPRSGLHPTVIKAVKELSAPYVLYVSCNPKAMVEDVKRMSEMYDLVKVEGVDLFPHTDHLEAVALLRSVYHRD
jgi:23S rRNA (uracil1939-C5)-methyltransferase